MLRQNQFVFKVLLEFTLLHGSIYFVTHSLRDNGYSID